MAYINGNEILFSTELNNAEGGNVNCTDIKVLFLRIDAGRLLEASYMRNGVVYNGSDEISSLVNLGANTQYCIEVTDIPYEDEVTGVCDFKITKCPAFSNNYTDELWQKISIENVIGIFETDENAQIISDSVKVYPIEAGVATPQDIAEVAQVFQSLEQNKIEPMITRIINLEKSWLSKPIETVTLDGTAWKYTKTGLNLEALLLVCESEVGTATQNAKIEINSSGKTDFYLGAYVSTSEKYTFCYIDLKNRLPLKGVGATSSDVPAQVSIPFLRGLNGCTPIHEIDTIDRIDLIDFSSKAMPNGTKITLYGKEKTQ